MELPASCLLQWERNDGGWNLHLWPWLFLGLSLQIFSSIWHPSSGLLAEVLPASRTQGAMHCQAVTGGGATPELM